MSLRRVRGVLLRLVRRRLLVILVGLSLAVPSAWIEWSGRPMPWWAGGVALVAGATGVALVWTGLSGERPDWIDSE